VIVSIRPGSNGKEGSKGHRGQDTVLRFRETNIQIHGLKAFRRWKIDW
jgi:hypothetical protein